MTPKETKAGKEKLVFLKIQKLANKMRVKAWLVNNGTGEKTADEYMNEIIDINNEIEKIYSTEW